MADYTGIRCAPFEPNPAVSGGRPGVKCAPIVVEPARLFTGRPVVGQLVPRGLK